MKGYRSHDVPEEAILRLTHRWAEAERNADTATLEGLLHESFRGIGPAGFVLDRDQWLERYRSGALQHRAFEVREPQLRTFGDVAAVVATQVQESSYRGHDSSGRFRLSLMLVFGHDEGSIAGLHLGALAEAEATGPGGRGG